MKTNPVSTILTAVLGLTATLHAADLAARWSFEESTPPFADAGPNNIPLVQDGGTATALSGIGISGNAAELNYQPVPGVATRLSASGAALQSNSFGFSFFINPVYLNPGDVLLGKEMSFDNSVPGYARKAWQVQVMSSGQLEFIVRGDDRSTSDFYGAVVSTNAVPLQTNSNDWIHIAGGYNATTGALTFYLDGVAVSTTGTPGATNSDGGAIAVGTQRNGSDFVGFAGGAQVDELQIFNAPLAADEVAYLRAHPSGTLADRGMPGLAVHWKLDEASAPYASSASPATLAQDTNSTPALSESPALIGNAAVLNFGTPPVATRLFSNAAALQTNSFSFSFWLRPDSLGGNDVILTKEIAPYAGADPSFSLSAWQLGLRSDDDSDGDAALQLVVRGSDRTGPPQPFYGEVTSTAELPLHAQSNTWIHIAGGYDAVTGAISLYVDDRAALASSNVKIINPGANNSDGSALSIGSSKNNTTFTGFAVGAAIDDVQIYSGLMTASQAASLTDHPGATLVSLANFSITTFNYNSTSGDMALAFSSLAGLSYQIQVSTDLSNWQTAKTVTGSAVTTSVALTKAEIDVALGSSSRPKAFVRIARP